MRWSYLVPRCVVLGLFWAFFAFAFDPMLRQAVMTGGEVAAGASVVVDDVSTSFFPPTISMQNVEVANKFSPRTNLVQFENFEAKLEGDPLLKKLCIVEEGKLTGLRWGTPHTGADTSELEEAAEGSGISGDAFKKLGEKAAGLGDKALDNLLDLAKDQLDPDQLESVRLAKQMQGQWQGRFDELKGRSDALKREIERIQKSIEQSKGKPLEQVDAYANAAERVDGILKEAKDIRRELSKLPKTAQVDYQALETAKNRDIEKIHTKVKLIRLDGETLSETLLGQELADQISESMMWIQFVRGQLSQVQEVEQPNRWRGIDIDFSKKDRLPEFLIRSLHVSGETELAGDRFLFNGVMTDVTTEPAVLGKPTVVKLKGSGPAEMNIEMVLDHTGEVPVDKMRLICFVPRSQQLSLGDKDGLAVEVSAEQTEIQAELFLRGDDLTGNIAFLQTPVALTAQTDENTDEHLQRAMQSALSGVNYLQANALLTGTLNNPRWKLDSNLGPEIANGLNQFVTNEIDTKKQELIGQIDQAARDQTAVLSKMLNREYGGVLAELDLNESTARGLIKRVAGKDLKLDRLNKFFRR